MTKKLFTLIILLFLLNACKTLGEHQRIDSLEDVLHRYEASIRWASGRQSHTFLPPEKVSEALTPVSDNIRVNHYEVVQGPTMLNEKRAVQMVEIEYVFQDTQILRRVKDMQDWRYDDEAKTWYLYSPIPEFK
ncbi:MAG: asparagine synthetase [Candidatus Thiodiazotropha sp.]